MHSEEEKKQSLFLHSLCQLSNIYNNWPEDSPTVQRLGFIYLAVCGLSFQCIDSLVVVHNTCISCLPDTGHSNTCKVLCHYGVYLHFPDDDWHWALPHLHVCHLCVFFEKFSIQYFCPFWNWIFFCYWVVCFFNKLIIFNWRMVALQRCVGFCHISTWISRRFKYVPSLLNPYSHLPPLLPL